jgi:ubiquitin-protein ligase E3 C
MFFSGDPSSRRKVDLGGRSNKERDRQKLLEEARLEREKRSRVRLQNQSAGRIQVLVKLLKSFAFSLGKILLGVLSNV